MRRHPLQGFAMIETLLAIFLLAIGLATTGFMISISTRGLSQGKFDTQAAFFAQMRMEEAQTENNAPAVKVDPDVPELTGQISRIIWSTDANLEYDRVIVYRSDDLTKRPIVELESIGTGGPLLP